MPTAETSTKVNDCNLKRSVCYKAGAPFFCQKCVKRIRSPQYIIKRNIRRRSKTMSKLCHVQILSPREVEGYSCEMGEAVFSRQIAIGMFRFHQVAKLIRRSYKQGTHNAEKF